MIHNKDDAIMNYRRYAGWAPKNFICPITLKEYSDNIIGGHVIPECWGVSNIKTPQLKLIDNKFGEVFESKTADHFKMQELFLEENPLKILQQTKSSSEKLWINRDRTEYYYNPEDPEKILKNEKNIPSHHSLLELNNQKMFLKTPPKALITNLEFNMFIDCIKINLEPFLITLLHSAYLHMFYYAGYRFVFSDCGEFMRTRLNNIVVNNYSDQIAETVYIELMNTLNMITDDGSGDLETSLTSETIYDCYTEKSGLFANMIIVRRENKLHSILIPHVYSNDFNSGIIKFQSFLNDGLNETVISIYKTKILNHGYIMPCKPPIRIDICWKKMNYENYIKIKELEKSGLPPP